MIIPVYKANDKTSVKNYRPISLLCNVSKVMEHLLYDKVYGVVSKHTCISLGFKEIHQPFNNYFCFFMN